MATTLTCPVPDSINPLSPNGFMFSIEKLPELKFFCQEVNLPASTLPEFDQYTPFTRVTVPGSILEYEPLRIQFMIDDQMANYKAIYDWMTGLGFPEANSQFNDLVQGNSSSANLYSYSDATLSILGNYNSVIANVIFVDCFPVSLESLVFTSTANDVQYLIGSVTFKYTLYKFI